MTEGLSIVPVPPVRTKSGALAALLGFVNEADATPMPFPGHADALGAFKIQQSSMSISLAVSLGYGSFFSGSASAKQQGFYLDAMAWSDQYEERGTQSPIIATRWGVGIRTLVRAFEISTDVSLSLGMVGAAIKMGLAHGEYMIEGYGVGGVDGLQIVLGELGSVGEFSYETYVKLTGPIAKKLADHVKANEKTLKPEPVGVVLARLIDPVAAAQSVYHAMRCIGERWTLGDALRRAQLGIDRPTVRLVYAQTAGITDEKAVPTREDERVADDWLQTRA